MDTLTLLLEINKKLDLLLKVHGITQDTTASKGKGSEEEDYKLGRQLARSMGPIRSDG
jgi:hypothetical protein